MTNTSTRQEPISELRQRLAFILGENPDDLHKIETRWSTLMREGAILELHIGRWRAQSQLRGEDLGLRQSENKEEQQAIDRMIQMGRKKLMSPRFIKRADAIDRLARKKVANAGYQTYWGPMVTNNTWPAVKSELSDLQNQYFELRDEVVWNYESWRAELADEYRHVARKSYRQLRAAGSDILDLPEEAWIERYVQRVLDLIPSPAAIRASYVFEWRLNFIPLPAQLADQRMHEEQVRREIEAQRQEDSLEWERRREEQRIEMEAEYARVRQENQLAQETYEHFRRTKTEQIDNFMRDVVVQLRQMVHEAMNDVLASLSRNDFVHPRSIVQLNGLLDSLGNMTEGFFQDRELDVMMNEVRRHLNQSADNRSVGEVSNTLRSIGTVVRSQLLELQATPRIGRSGLDPMISQVPSLDEVRTARASLGLETPIEVPELTRGRDVRTPEGVPSL